MKNLEGKTNDTREARESAVATNAESAAGKVAINPLFNDAFVHVFGREESKGVTRSLVNSLLREAGLGELGEIDEIHAEYSDVGEVVGCKGSRFDVLIVADDRASLVDLEAQMYPDDVSNRALMYASRIMSTRVTRGTTYDELPRVAVMTLLDTESMFPDDDAIVSTANMCWHVGDGTRPATDRFQFVVVDLVKARKRYNRPEALDPSDEAAAWMYALTNGYRDREGMGSVMEKFPSIEEFAKRYDRAVSDPEVIRAYEAEADRWRELESRERWLARREREATERGEAKGLEIGEAKGFEKGLEKGLEEGLERAIAVLESNGADPSLIEELKAQH